MDEYMKSKYLIYRDPFITMFHDDEKYMVVFVNDRGECAALSYDDNFYCVEEEIIAYVDLINRSFNGWKSEEKDECIRKFIKHIEKKIKPEQLNWEYLEHCGIKK